MDEHKKGLIFGFSAFLIWGFSPLFFKLLHHVPPFQILAHRIFWSTLLLLAVVAYRKGLGTSFSAFKKPEIMKILALTAALIGGNWFLYIFSIVSDRVLESSIGYYINPLVNVLLGYWFLKERFSKQRLLAIVLATLGVAYLTWQTGTLSWLSLSLAFSFGFYGLLRKTVGIGALEGLLVETLILGPPAGLYLLYLWTQGQGAFAHVNLRTDLLLAATSLITTIPLLLFTGAARRVNLSTVGFIQYIAPTSMFFLSVFLFREPFTRDHLITFILIWSGILVFSTTRR